MIERRPLRANASGMLLAAAGVGTMPTDPKMIPQLDLLGNFQPLLMGDDWKKAIAGTVIDAALTTGAYLLPILTRHETENLLVPLNRLTEDDLGLTPVKVYMGEDVLPAQLITQLEPGLTSVLHAAHAAAQGKTRNVGMFWKEYRKAMWNGIARFAEENILKTKIEGFQAHLAISLNVPYDTAHIGVGMAMTLARQKDLDLTILLSHGMTGVVFQRFPVAAPEGCARINLIVNPKLHDLKIHVHPLRLLLENQADVDGDIGYLGFDGETRVNAKKVEADKDGVGAYIGDRKPLFLEPDFEVRKPVCEACEGSGKVEGKKCAICKGKKYLPTPGLREYLATYVPSPSREATVVRDTNQILQSQVKLLTGQVTWVLWALARGFSEGRRRLFSPVDSYKIVYRAGVYIIEKVMDAGKITDTSAEAFAAAARRVQELSGAVRGLMNGLDLDADIPQLPGVAVLDPFKDILPPEALDILQQAYRESNNLYRGKLSVGGRLVTGGKNLKSLGWNLQQVVGWLEENGVLPYDILARIQSCVRMENVTPIDPPKLGDPKEPTQWARCAVKPSLDWVTSFGMVKQRGQDERQVFTNMQLAQENGLDMMLCDLLPIWVDNPDNYWRDMRIILPTIHNDPTDPTWSYGHAMVTLGNSTQYRLYKPVVGFTQTTENGVVMLKAIIETIYDTLKRVIKQAFLDWKAEGRNGVKATMQQSLDRAVLEWFHTLPIVQRPRDGSEMVVDPMMVMEMDVYIPRDKTRDLLDFWGEAEELMNQLLLDNERVSIRSGFDCPIYWDILATSKGSPLETIGIAGPSGLAGYGPYINPFYHMLAPKRRSEIRELRDAPKLAFPTALSVTQVTSAGVRKDLPIAYKDKVCEAWTVFLDSNYNVYENPHTGKLWTFDPLLVTDEGTRLFELVEELFTAGSPKEVGRMVQRLKNLGVDKKRIALTSSDSFMGYLGNLGAVYKEVYDLWVKAEGVDKGKLKALLGAIKGVMIDLPCNLAAVMPNGHLQPIHVVWSTMSAQGKRSADAAAYMGAAKGGLSEVNPDWTTDQLATKIEEALVSKGFDPSGKQKIAAIYQDREHPIVWLGEHFCGPLPYFRGPQTDLHIANWRTGRDGITIEHQSMIMAGVQHRQDERQNTEFVQRLSVIGQIPAPQNFEDDWA